MSGELTDVEKLILAKLDQIDKKLTNDTLQTRATAATAYSKFDEKLTKVRIAVASMTVIIALVTSSITATVVMSIKDTLAQPAIVQNKED
ncbi:MAG: hypothetical protein KAG61_11020 [Bacteriovoracaceae bacterium]|nr:hypothetical protein [Bacteriovoracaceae bacterium]